MGEAAKQEPSVTVPRHDPTTRRDVEECHACGGYAFLVNEPTPRWRCIACGEVYYTGGQMDAASDYDVLEALAQMYERRAEANRRSAQACESEPHDDLARRQRAIVRVLRRCQERLAPSASSPVEPTV